jgi:hypothetical protein
LALNYSKNRERQLLDKFRDHEDEMTIEEGLELKHLIEKTSEDTKDVVLVFACALLNVHILRFLRDKKKENKPLTKLLSLFSREIHIT